MGIKQQASVSVFCVFDSVLEKAHARAPATTILGGKGSGVSHAAASCSSQKQNKKITSRKSFENLKGIKWKLSAYITVGSEVWHPWHQFRFQGDCVLWSGGVNENKMLNDTIRVFSYKSLFLHVSKQEMPNPLAKATLTILMSLIVAMLRTKRFTRTIAAPSRGGKR